MNSLKHLSFLHGRTLHKVSYNTNFNFLVFENKITLIIPSTKQVRCFLLLLLFKVMKDSDAQCFLICGFQHVTATNMYSKLYVYSLLFLRALRIEKATHKTIKAGKTESLLPWTENYLSCPIPFRFPKKLD